MVTWDLGDWSANFRTYNFTSKGTFLDEEDERRLLLEQTDGNTQVIVAEPTAWEERACRIADEYSPNRSGGSS
jgi:hypothetical protein